MNIFLRAHKNEKGFSIMELVVAAALIAVGVTSVLVMFNSSLRTNTNSKVRALANSLMNEKIEMARTVDYENLTDAYLGSSLGTTVTKGGVVFAVSYLVTAIDDAADGEGVNDTNPVDFKNIRITIAWTNPAPGASIQSETIINNNPPENVTYNDDTTAPVWPNGGNVLTATARQTTLDIFLVWAPNWATDAKGVVGYLVYCRDPSLTEYLLVATTAPSIGSFPDASVIGGSTYSYYVKAYDSKGNISAPSNTVTLAGPLDTIPPSMPTELTGYASSSTTVVLNWKASTDNSLMIKHYNIYRTKSGSPFGSSPFTTCVAPPFNDSGLIAGTPYQYYIEAVDNSNNTSARTSAITVTP